MMIYMIFMMTTMYTSVCILTGSSLWDSKRFRDVDFEKLKREKEALNATEEPDEPGVEYDEIEVQD